MGWREEYRDKGYIVVDNVLPHDLIDTHLAAVASLSRRHGVKDARSYATLSPEGEDALLSAMLDLHHGAEVTRRLVAQPVLRAILRQLFDAEPVLTMARSALWERGDMRAHVDTAFRSPDPPYSVCRTWCALEDIRPGSGCFYLVPSTHRTLTPHLCREVLDERPELRRLSDEVLDDPSSWFRLHGRAWSYVSAKVADRIIPAAKVSPRLNKGDVVFFNPAVAHGTLPRADPFLTRKMMVCEWTAAEPVSRHRLQAPAVPDRLDLDFAAGNLVDLASVRAARAASR